MANDVFTFDPKSLYHDLEQYLFLPYLQNIIIKEGFMNKMKKLSSDLVSDFGSIDAVMLSGMYLADESFASAWHHIHLMTPKA